MSRSPEIVDLDELVPDDIEFRYRDKSYLLPGDPPNEVVLALVKHYERMLSDVIFDEEGTSDDRTKDEIEAEVEAAIEATKAVLLGLFQLNDPELTEWPFGMYSTQHVARHVLLQLGILRLVDEKDGDGDPPTIPTPKKPPARRRARSGS